MSAITRKTRRKRKTRAANPRPRFSTLFHSVSFDSLPPSIALSCSVLTADGSCRAILAGEKTLFLHRSSIAFCARRECSAGRFVRAGWNLSITLKLRALIGNQNSWSETIRNRVRTRGVKLTSWRRTRSALEIRASGIFEIVIIIVACYNETENYRGQRGNRARETAGCSLRFATATPCILISLFTLKYNRKTRQHGNSSAVLRTDMAAISLHFFGPRVIYPHFITISAGLWRSP
jgi:hypothetical protein